MTFLKQLITLKQYRKVYIEYSNTSFRKLTQNTKRFLNKYLREEYLSVIDLDFNKLKVSIVLF